MGGEARMLRIIALLSLCLVSAGCALGNLTAIHKGSSITPSSSTEQTGPYGLFIGAKQRAVLSNTVADESIVYQYDDAGQYIGSTTTVSKKRVVCAEPSPDALSAVSAQTGISISRLSTAISGIQVYLRRPPILALEPRRFKRSGMDFIGFAKLK